MPQRKPLEKSKYGRLTVVRDLPPMPAYTKSGRKISLRKVECICDCGKTVLVDASNLWRGNTTSCGCRDIEATIFRSSTHGGCSRPEYRIWQGMKSRCNNPKNPGFELYGGRGIKVCDSWDKSFDAFFEDMGQRPSKNHSLERKDNSKGYSKDNCKWATVKEQTRNRRVTFMVDFKGTMTPLAEVAEATGESYKFLYDRVRNGWTIGEALKYPKNAKIKSKRIQTTTNE